MFTSFANYQWVESDKLAIPFSEDPLGCIRGYRIFTALKAVDGVYFHKEDHIHRLLNSAKKLTMPVDLTFDEISRIFDQIIAQNKANPTFLSNVFLTGGKSDTSGTGAVGTGALYVWNVPLKLPTDEMVEKGVVLATYPYQRPFPEIKLTFYVGAVIATQTVVKTHQADYPLFVSLDPLNPLVLEGSTFSIFVVKDGRLITPPLDGHILDSITRRVVLRLGKKCAIPVVEAPITLPELLAADEVFLASSTRNVLAVSRINASIIGKGKPGDITRRLRKEFLEYEKAYLEQAKKG